MPLPASPPAPSPALRTPDAGFGTDIPATLAWVRQAGRVAPLPGQDTAAAWDLLAASAERDVAAARMLEPHLDAIAILAQARAEGEAPELDRLAVDDDSTWGVYAAEAPGIAVRARRDGGWRLTGTKPWCSLAGHLSHALVTAWVDDRRRGLFAVALDAPGVRPHAGPWAARGLSQVVSAPLDLVDVPAVAIGEPDWYLRRPGFAWGGMGVAAVWHGGARPVVARLREAAAREGADQVSAVSAGVADAAEWASATVLADAAGRVDAGADRAAGALLAARVRAVVAGGVRRILAEEAAALGPGPVATDDEHARRVADLGLYLRQDHAMRDLARLGRRSGGRS